MDQRKIMENLRGILFMILAMAGFAFEDLFIKMLSAYFPISEVIIILGFTGSIVFLIIALFQKAPIFHKDLLNKHVIIRTICELLGAVFFVTAIALTPLSSATAILQITPLLVTIGAVIFFREKVGWRRWTAVFIGFMGVLLIVRPGYGGFMPASIFALLGALFLAARDLATRAMKVDLPSVTIALYAFIAFGILRYFDYSIQLTNDNSNIKSNDLFYWSVYLWSNCLLFTCYFFSDWRNVSYIPISIFKNSICNASCNHNSWGEAR